MLLAGVCLLDCASWLLLSGLWLLLILGLAKLYLQIAACWMLAVFGLLYSACCICLLYFAC